MSAGKRKLWRMGERGREREREQMRTNKTLALSDMENILPSKTAFGGRKASRPVRVKYLYKMLPSKIPSSG